jgi:hypothetical protein
MAELYAVWGVVFLAVIGIVFYFSYRGDSKGDVVSARAPAKSITASILMEALPQPVTPKDSKAPPDASPPKGKDNPPAAVIQLGSRAKFGVKWNEVEGGLKIVQVKAGPLKNAGLRKDDLIAAIDGETATDERLLKARDNIVSGATEGAKLIVLRDKERLYFELRK